jgi:hypothetical protein
MVGGGPYRRWGVRSCIPSCSCGRYRCGARNGSEVTVLAGIRERLNYANVMATIAVFGVLAGGGAYAASQIGPKDIAKNAVRAKHVKKGQIKAKHLARSSVRTPKIQDGAVTAAKLADGVAVSGPQGPPGADLLGAMSGDTLVASSSTVYCALDSGTAPFGECTVSGERETLSPNRTITLSDFYAESLSPAESTIIFTVRVDDVATTLGCTIASSSDSCAPSSGSVAVPAHSRLSVQVLNNAFAGGRRVFWTVTVS